MPRTVDEQRCCSLSPQPCIVCGLARVISSRDMDSLALGYLGIEEETIKNFKYEKRDDTEAFNRSIIRRWAYKNSGPQQRQVNSAMQNLSNHFTSRNFAVRIRRLWEGNVFSRVCLLTETRSTSCHPLLQEGPAKKKYLERTRQEVGATYPLHYRRQRSLAGMPPPTGRVSSPFLK